MKPAHSGAYRQDIEGLRGVAVLLVVAFHCGVAGFSGGFIGVDVFFVLSGYLISGLLVNEVRKTSRISLSAFYARRVRRLLPASALTLTATLAIGAVILAPNEVEFAARAGRATAIYLSNMFFAGNAADYFAPNVETNPLLHTWSLAVEEQFYLFWPLLIMLGLQFWKSTRALLLVLSTVALLSLAACLWFTANGGAFAFYGLPARAWEFALGGLAALLPPGFGQYGAARWRAAGWIGLAAILASGALISPGPGFPGWKAIAPVLGTVIALVAGAELPHAGVGRLLDIGPLQLFGKLSYSWYLWHWPFLVFGAALFPNIGVAGKSAAAVLALIVAALAHRLVENPIRFHPYLLKRAPLTLALGLAVTVGSLTASLLAGRWAHRLALGPANRNISLAIADIAAMPREQCVTLGESPDVKSCVFGAPASAVDIALFGDSHAIQWFNAFKQIAESRGWRLTTFLKSGCPAVDVNPPGTSPRGQANCAAWRRQAIQRIADERPAAVVMASASQGVLRGALSVEEWRLGTARTLRSLSAASIRVVALRDTPLAPFDVPTCLARSAGHSWRPGGACEIDRAAAVDPRVFRAEQDAASGLPNVRFLDMTDALCGRSACSAVLDGSIVYRDDNHLTGSFAARLAPAVAAKLLAILNTPAAAASARGGELAPRQYQNHAEYPRR